MSGYFDQMKAKKRQKTAPMSHEYFDDLDKVASVHAVFPGELTIMLRQWLGSITFVERDLSDLPKAARQWFNRYGVRYPGVDGTLYRGLKNKKGGVKWLVNALDSGRVNLRKNDLESWSYSFDTARHFMVRQDTGPFVSAGHVGILLSKAKVANKKVVFDFPFVGELLESHGLDLSELFHLLYEKEVITTSVCGVCELKDIEMVMYPMDEEGEPVRAALTRAYPNAEWVVKDQYKGADFNVVKTSKKELTLVDPYMPFRGKPNRPPGKYGRD